jgi:hypothetical protein
LLTHHFSHIIAHTSLLTHHFSHITSQLREDLITSSAAARAPRSQEHATQQALKNAQSNIACLEQQVNSLRDEVKALKHDNQLHVLKHGHLQQQLDTLLICCRSAEARADDAHAALQRAVDMAAVTAEDVVSTAPARHELSPHSIKLSSDGGIRHGDMSGGFISVHSESFASFTSHVMRLVQSDVEQLAGSVTHRSGDFSGGVGNSNGNGGGGVTSGDIGFESGSRYFMSDNDCMLYDLLQEVRFLYTACGA